MKALGLFGCPVSPLQREYQFEELEDKVIIRRAGYAMVVAHLVLALFWFLLPVKAPAASLPSLNLQEKVVALTILGEARGEGQKGMEGVACVIQERALSKCKAPDVVCKEKQQFSCWNGGKRCGTLQKEVTEKTPAKVTAYAATLAKKVVSGESLDRSMVSHANHYCTVNTYPKWAQGKKPVAVVGHHKFFKL